VSSRFQLFSISEVFAQSRDAGGQGSSDPGAVSAGIQAVLFEGKGRRPPSPPVTSACFMAEPRGYRHRHRPKQCILLVSTDLAGFHFDINGFASEQTDARSVAPNSGRRFPFLILLAR